jgi:NAD-dependent deacetylase
VSSEPPAAADPAVLAEAQGWIRAARRIVVLTGAGISTDSGIPDFRGPNGLWTKNPAAERASTLSHYLHEPEVRRASWQTRLHSPAWAAQPNDGHLALVELERQGRLEALVTQNIDGLHQRAGNDPALVVEVHGTMRRYQCWGCGDTGPMEVMLERVRAGEEDPACQLCGGIVKSATISFGQSLVPEVIDAALAAAARADLLLAVGSTLQVYPAANVVPRAKAAGARVVIVNGQPTHMDRYADALLIGPIGELLPALVAPAVDPAGDAGRRS